jgi:hypothetical protein
VCVCVSLGEGGLQETQRLFTVFQKTGRVVIALKIKRLREAQVFTGGILEYILANTKIKSRKKRERNVLNLSPGDKKKLYRY